MFLSKEERAALPDSAFAVPRTRQVPLTDARHVRMAESTLSRTKGLTPDELIAGRAHIARRAHELGMSADSEITFDLSAMSLDMPTDEHPNRMPFSGIMTRVDEPSDEPPGGANGKRVYIPKAVAEAALPTLMGMGVDTTPEFDGHDAQFKIGVITEATIQGNAVHIAGFLYASDFPEECARIKSEKSSLGFSYECKVSVSDKKADPWMVDRIIFTGAAILYKDKAAYRTTSLAATADKEDAMTPEELKKLNDSIAALQATVDAQSKELKEIKAGKGASLAGPIIDQAMPHVGACNAAADAMEAAGIGTHPMHGHAAVLRRVGASILHAATMGKMPQVYHEDGMSAAADPKVKEAADQAAADAKAQADKIASLETQVADLKAAAAKVVPAPERKTLSNGAQALLSKYGVKDGEQITASNVDDVLKAAGVATGSRSIEAKLKLRAEGLLG